MPDIMRMGKNPNYLGSWDLEELPGRERELRKYPICDHCDERITDDYLYRINGVSICETCLKEDFRRKTEDYMEE